MELEIKGTVYEFKATFGFLKEANKLSKSHIDAFDVDKNTGFRYLAASLYDGDVEALRDMLFYLNYGQDPRVTKKLIEEYIESECEDVDKLFDDVMGFLADSNVTKKTMKALDDQIKIAQESQMN